MKQICLYLLLANIQHVFLVMNPDTSLGLWGREEGGSLLIHSFADPSLHHLPDPGVIIWPRSEILTLTNREEQIYDKTSRWCLTQSARLHLLRISSWPVRRNNLLPSKQKQIIRRMLPISANILQKKLPIGNWNKSAGGNSWSRVCVRDK